MPNYTQGVSCHFYFFAAQSEEHVDNSNLLANLSQVLNNTYINEECHKNFYLTRQASVNRLF